MVELLNTFIEVTIPLNPLDPVNPVINSDGVVGTGAITLGTEALVYPSPGLVIVTEVIIPFVMLPVAIAVDPIPIVPSPFMKVVIPVVGIPTDKDVVVPTYPLPPLFTVIDSTVPPIETTADKLAACGVMDSSTTSTPILVGFS